MQNSTLNIPTARRPTPLTVCCLTEGACACPAEQWVQAYTARPARHRLMWIRLGATAMHAIIWLASHWCPSCVLSSG
eukprot:3679032-Pyramimonas_sp.AAC.1